MNCLIQERFLYQPVMLFGCLFILGECVSVCLDTQGLQLYAPTVSRIRLSPFYPVITAGVIFFDPQWLLVLSIPILISFISLVVFSQKVKFLKTRESNHCSWFNFYDILYHPRAWYVLVFTAY